MNDPTPGPGPRRKRDVLLEGTKQAVSRQEYVQLVRSNRWWHGLAALGVVAVLITAALGGFRKAPPPVPAPGSQTAGGSLHEPRDVGQYRLVPLEVTYTDRKPGERRPGRTPEQYIVLRLSVRNLSTTGRFAHQNLQEDLVWLRNGRSEPKPADAIQWRDTHGSDIVLPPGLDVELDAVWIVPPGESPPTRIEIGASQRAAGARNTVGEAFLGEWRRTGKGRFWSLPVRIAQPTEPL